MISTIYQQLHKCEKPIDWTNIGFSPMGAHVIERKERRGSVDFIVLLDRINSLVPATFKFSVVETHCNLRKLYWGWIIISNPKNIPIARTESLIWSLSMDEKLSKQSCFWQFNLFLFKKKGLSWERDGYMVYKWIDLGRRNLYNWVHVRLLAYLDLIYIISILIN